MTIGDVSSLLTVMFAAIALAFGWFTFSRQKTSSDVETMLSIYGKINEYWDRFIDEKQSSTSVYNMGQILSYFENACFLVNKKIVSRDASACIEDHIYEVWTNLNNRVDSKEYFEKFVSADSTFCEIKKFVKNYDVRKIRH